MPLRKSRTFLEEHNSSSPYRDGNTGWLRLPSQASLPRTATPAGHRLAASIASRSESSTGSRSASGSEDTGLAVYKEPRRSLQSWKSPRSPTEEPAISAGYRRPEPSVTLQSGSPKPPHQRLRRRRLETSGFRRSPQPRRSGQRRGTAASSAGTAAGMTPTANPPPAHPGSATEAEIRER